MTAKTRYSILCTVTNKVHKIDLRNLPNEALISDRDVARLFGISSASAWRWVREGRLPAPIGVGPCLTRWRLGDISQYDLEMSSELDYRILARRGDLSGKVGDEQTRRHSCDGP